MSDEFGNLREKLEKAQRDILDNFYNRNLEECKSAQKDSIEQDKRHTTLVNMCAFAFSEAGPLAITGYHFITVEPLYKYRTQKGNKIFDLILYNRKFKRAILIECKSSIGDPRRDVLNPLKDQKDTVLKLKEELEDEVGGEITDNEYVICSLPHDIEEVYKALKDDDSVCLWSADLFMFTPKLYNPVGFASEETQKLIAKNQLHKDEGLRKPLYGKTESTGQIEGIRITPSSHICRILSRVFVRITQSVMLKSTEQEKRFWLRELTEMVQEELPVLSVEDANRISTTICEIAIKIKIIEAEAAFTTSPSDRAFRLRINARSARMVENSIEEKYIDEICKERTPKVALDEFREYLRTNSGSLDYHFSKASKELQE